MNTLSLSSETLIVMKLKQQGYGLALIAELIGGALLGEVGSSYDSDHDMDDNDDDVADPDDIVDGNDNVVDSNDNQQAYKL